MREKISQIDHIQRNRDWLCWLITTTSKTYCYTKFSPTHNKKWSQIDVGVPTTPLAFFRNLRSIYNGPAFIKTRMVLQEPCFCNLGIKQSAIVFPVIFVFFCIARHCPWKTHVERLAWWQWAAVYPVIFVFLKKSHGTVHEKLMWKGWPDGSEQPSSPWYLCF